MEYGCDGFSKSLSNFEGQISDFNLNIENKTEFLSNLEANKKLIKNRNKPFHAPMRQCQLCSFQTNSTMVLDQHLTQPHRYNSVFICNFCESSQMFRTSSKIEYQRHLMQVHGRLCEIEKPFATCMCSNCDFECGKIIISNFQSI